MKQLIAGIVLLLVIGIGGFLYRNSLEHPIGPIATSPTPQECTADARICPDGSGVGRTGPNCSFAACAFPNAEDAAIGLGFVVPAGYTAKADGTGADESIRAIFEKPSTFPNVAHTITIRRFTIPEGKTANTVIIANTMFSPSGNPATSMSDFKTVVINGKSFSTAVLERFEGQVHSVYYLARANDVLRFEILEHDVDWTNPALVIGDLPEHKAFVSMLATLQTQ